MNIEMAANILLLSEESIVSWHWIVGQDAYAVIDTQSNAHIVTGLQIHEYKSRKNSTPQ